MRLAYGKRDAHLIHISEVERGAGDLVCPYCEAPLVAKKGKQTTHHFAHLKRSCWKQNSYDFFGLTTRLPIQLKLLDYALLIYGRHQKHFSALQRRQQYTYDKQQGYQERIREYCQRLKTQSANDYQSLRSYLFDEFSPFPNLSYTKEVYLALQRYHPQRHLVKELTDKIELYEAEKNRFQRFSLYFLRIRVGQQAVFYKIGITARSLSVRLSEIERDLSFYFSALQIEVLATLDHAAFLERFFKQKYQNQRYELAQFTEYFMLQPHEVEEILEQCQQIRESSVYQSFCA